MLKVDFYIWKTDDYWVRDNGPIFVFDQDDNLVIQNWGFNGWGNKTRSSKCDDIPKMVGQVLGIDVIEVDMINEGASVELDGRGTLMAKKSSILNSNRNPGLNQADVEDYFRTYLGVENFIWLDGIKGQDITDDPNDTVANHLMQNIYPNKTIVGIPAIEIGLEGGGVHCVTQQQPLFS